MPGNKTIFASLLIAVAVWFPVDLSAQSRKAIGLTASPSIGQGVGGSQSNFRSHSSGVGALARPQAQSGGILSSSIGRTTLGKHTQRSMPFRGRGATGSALAPRNTHNFTATRGQYGGRNIAPGLGMNAGKINRNIRISKQPWLAATSVGQYGRNTSPAYTIPSFTPDADMPSPAATLGGRSDSTSMALHSGQFYAAALDMNKKGPLETKPDQKQIDTLVPQRPGMYREAMLQGEKSFRENDFRAAANSFKLANELSLRSTESLLSLMHTHFATARGNYRLTSYYLREVLQGFPELGVVPVHPKNFYGHPSDFVRDLIRLEKYVRKNRTDANALFVLGYMKWRDQDPAGARKNLSEALSHSQGEKLSEAIRTLWDGMVASGEVSGELVPTGKESKKSSKESQPPPAGNQE